ncbi:DUF3983 domain-containing protein [Peribacillus asahii]|nr:DUF3983 domain-containing protein [Peribacillus asahii]
MTVKQKRRLRKSLVKREKSIGKLKTDKALRNIFVKTGVLENTE